MQNNDSRSDNTGKAGSISPLVFLPPHTSPSALPLRRPVSHTPRNYLSALEAGTIPPLPELHNCLHSSGKADTGDSGENNEALHPVSEENLPSCPYFSPVNTGKADYILLP